MSSRFVFQRHIVTDDSNTSDLFRAPMRGDHNLMLYKALLRRSNNYYAVKVGAFSSGGRIGQTLQGVGTAIIPGDTSEFRSPVRSRVYSALMPGGIPGTRLSVPSRSGRGYRCPEGFQYGGRFTDNRFSTCGQMLFDVFALGRTLGQMLKPIPRDRTSAPDASGQVNIIPGLSPQDRQIIISRSAQIPKVSEANPAKRASSVLDAVAALRETEDGTTVMIRRDGYGLRPVVSTAILRTVPDNRNMEGAVFLTSTSKLDSLGTDELGLLSNTGVEQLVYVAPNGVELSLRKVRPLTVGERRKLGRTVADVAKMKITDDPTIRLRALADNSNGSVQYSEKFGSISKPNDMVDATVNGVRTRVKRWVSETYLSKRGRNNQVSEPGAVGAAVAPDAGKISSLAEAVKHLNAGGDPREILPSLLPIALQRTNAYQVRKLSRTSRLFSRQDGTQIRESISQVDFEHIGAAFTSDIQRQLGLPAAAIVRSGSGKRQPYLSVRSGADRLELVPADNLDNVAPAEMLKLAVSDWLTDSRSRTPLNTSILDSGQATSAVASDFTDVALSGLPRNEQSRRQRLKLDEFMNNQRSTQYKRAFAALNDQQRRLIVTQLEGLIQRASNFSWKDYVARLNADGKLSQAELAHLQIIRGMFETRLNTLKASKEAFSKLIGA